MTEVGASYRTPQSLSLASPKDGLLANSSTRIDIPDSSVRSPGFRVEDDLSPKIEASETEMLIDQIPASNTDRASNPVDQTPIRLNGFRKPALPLKGRLGLSRSLNASAESTFPRFAPVKRPNGKQSHLDNVETDIESSQELPPLKRPKLTTSRQSSLAEPRSFNSINQEAQDMTTGDVLSPRVAEDPLRDWPGQDTHDPESQVNLLHQDAITETGIQKQNEIKRQPSSEPKHDTQDQPPWLGTTIHPKITRATRSEQNGLVERNPSQSHERNEHNGQDPTYDTQSDQLDVGASKGVRDNRDKEHDTFDIPSSPSPDLPTSAQTARKSNINVIIPSHGGKMQSENRKFNLRKNQETPAKGRGRKPSRTSPKNGSLGAHSLTDPLSQSKPRRQKTLELTKSPEILAHGDGAHSAARVPSNSNCKNPTQSRLALSKSKEKSRLQAGISKINADEETQKEESYPEGRRRVAGKMDSIQAHKQQRKSFDSNSPKVTTEKHLVKPGQPGNDFISPTAQEGEHLGSNTPTKKMDPKALGRVPTGSILRLSTSQERRSGSSVSFVDVQQERTSTINPTPGPKNASFQSVNLLKKRKSNETRPAKSEMSENIKVGSNGASKNNESSAGKPLGVNNLAKGKERMQESGESVTSGPEVIKATVLEKYEDYGGCEPYTIDGNRGPSRNPRVYTLKSFKTSDSPAISHLDAQIPNASNVKSPVDRAPGGVSGKAESAGESSGPSSPRSPAKEVMSSSGSSAEGSVNQDNPESGPEGEESDLEGSEEATSVPEQTQPSMHVASISQSSTLNWPITAEHPTKLESAIHGSKSNGLTEKAQEAATSEEPEDRAEDDEADLQLQTENRRSLELGSSQKRLDYVERPPKAKEPASNARPKNSQASRAKVPLQTQTPNAKPLVSAKLPRAVNGRFVPVSALNAKAKTNISASQKPPMNSTRPIQSNGLSSAKAIQIDSPEDSDDSSSDGSEVEIKANSEGRQSKIKALKGLVSVQNRK